MKDLMVDIETLSTKKNAAVLSIGAVYFDRKTGDIGEKFYLPISKDSALIHGVTDPETMKWWDSQSEDARKAAFSGKLDAQDVAVWFSQFIKPDSIVWGNGSIFDITILENWFDSVGVKVPWDFWNVRDVRTIVDWFDINTKSFEREGVHHNAIDDCIFQVKYMCGGSKKIDKSKDEFEKYCKEIGLSTEVWNGNYNHNNTSLAWKAWQASRESLEVVGYMESNGIDYINKHGFTHVNDEQSGSINIPLYKLD